MPRTDRALYRLLIGLLLACGAAQLTAVAGASAAPAAEQYVKYYTVAGSYRDEPENLTEIAVRFLGDGSRSTEIFTLNSGRRQPGGGTLTDPKALREGWSLVLPWDAYGDGVRYGLLPGTASPSPTPSASPPPTRQQTTPARPEPPVQQPAPPAAAPPTPATPEAPPAPPSQDCGVTGPAAAESTWAQQRLAPEGAWETTRGNGVIVAVVDSGVDASLPQLSGRVIAGADITAGDGNGDSDCLGSGTGMAAIIAGASDQPDTPSGLAPDATILPIRVVGDGGPADPAEEATAIEVAVSAGAGVIAVGTHVDPGDPLVSAAISNALTHDVLVVVPATATPLPEPAKGADGALITVGAVDADGALAGEEGASADVVAPGIGVATLGVNGSGTITTSGPQYAVAFVAGQAALVRAAHPGLNAAQVKHRIEVTADRMETDDDGYGWGLINPVAAVSAVVEGEVVTPPAASDPGIGLGAVIAMVIVVLIMLAAVALLVLRARRWAQGPVSEPYEAEVPVR
ncbi:S8 family serine peptidase [Catenuloplanes atrovinosus]|uniref:Peptidase S8/S53 domain-containing protein n=1 Tax=Catenuloplanes atrovinosus TaxID=137266 RepID=A0AAE3YIC4_9ACTN|nr:S8 family serine peptidase [Catenuloplanes atrovinosus]MDR7274234.1 hypothetical protein [Catenuloplanes atrovinosus]